jgi:hypothetical protein
LECEEEKFLPKTNGRPFLVFKKVIYKFLKTKRRGECVGLDTDVDRKQARRLNARGRHLGLWKQH